MGFKTDIEIAQESVMQPITEVAKTAGVDEKYLEQYGKYKAKVDYNILKDMADKSIWLEMPDASEVLVRWFNRVVINKGKGTFSIKFHEDMFPYLANLSERYTQYSLENVLPMKSKYGLRLYELLKSYQNLGGLKISLSELRKRLDCDSYPRYPDFRVNVIERALADINEYSDIAVSYTALKNGRSYTDIVFEITEPNKEDSYVRHLNREGALQPEQE